MNLKTSKQREESLQIIITENMVEVKMDDIRGT